MIYPHNEGDRFLWTVCIFPVHLAGYLFVHEFFEFCSYFIQRCWYILYGNWKHKPFCILVLIFMKTSFFCKTSKLALGPIQPPVQKMKLTFHLHLVRWLRMSAATFFSPSMSSWHGQGKLQLYLGLLLEDLLWLVVQWAETEGTVFSEWLSLSQDWQR